MNNTAHSITINNKAYPYTIKRLDQKTSFFECKAANIAQEFLNEDIPPLLIDLPELILSEKNYRAKNKEILRFRLTSEEKSQIEKKAVQNGYSTVSAFLRSLALKN